MEVMLPCDNLYLRSDVTQRHCRDCPRNQMLNCSVEREIAFLFEKEIEYQRQLDQQRKDLARRYDWTL